VVKILKQVGLLPFACLFLLSTCPHSEIPASAQKVNDPYELVVATIYEPDTVDPAWAYDATSQELIFNVYETLLFYDRESVDEFVPMLATDWWISDDGLTYTFEIREAVKFHNGETLTTEDVEYSFERVMVQDRTGGPVWMFYEPLLGCWHANLSDPEWGEKIDNAVQSNATHVWFNLPTPYAPFLQILCQSWSSIVNKHFCVEHGDWPGTWDNWQDHHNPDVYSPLDDPEPVMCGTGPYMFDYWKHGLEFSVAKFDDYWGGWPAPHPVSGTIRGYVERAIVKFVDEWTGRRLLFLSGDLDCCYVPRMNMEDVWDQSGIRCVYPLPKLYCGGVFFNYNISLKSRYLKPPFTSYECGYGELNENGLPPDFFADINVRNGFAYSINYTEFLQIVYDGEGLHPSTPAITGLPYRNPEQEKIEFDLARAVGHFKRAWNGQLWTNGFTLTFSYSAGNIARETIVKMFEDNIEGLNPKFHITPYPIEWGSAHYPELLRGELPLFVTGWLGDYPDPHNFFHPFMHSEGALAGWQFRNTPYVDALIDEGLHTLDATRRRQIYYELQQIYGEECPSIAVSQWTDRHWERDWVQGWYYNPAFPGLYFYHLWKENLPSEDLNTDGTVNILDVAAASEAFGSYYQIGRVHPRWNSRIDSNQDQSINILDIANIAKKFGYTAPAWIPP
jgi:peptide/nickel transport system substrate-binding protein